MQRARHYGVIGAAGLLFLLAGVVASAHAERVPPPGMSAEDASVLAVREQAVTDGIRPDTLRRHLRILTEVPHVAGTSADRATAEYVRDRLAAYGWDADIVEIPVLLNYPLESRLTLLEPTRETLAARERGVSWDKDAFDERAFDAFHGYGASGHVTGDAVYANYGDVGDFKKLAELGVDVHDRIVLVRYGRIFRGLKVRNAQNAGAAGVVIFSDPADDGFTKDDPYPRGQGRPEDGIQRGSVQFLSEFPGDPSTPGWPSTKGGRHLSLAQSKGIPSIPSLPLAAAEAERILGAMEGPVVPSGWQGALPFTYHVGPGPARLEMTVHHDYAVRPIWNVIARLEGREYPDQWVLCGNHRDAWTFGALDPNSGTITLLEMARGIGALAKSGWRPRRTIVLCSWDGEEYGLLGSTEWCEANAEVLQQKAVAYLNVDVGVSGKTLRLTGAHALRDVVVSALDEVRHPGDGTTLYESWKNAQWTAGKAAWAVANRERRWRGEPEQPFAPDLAPLGSGSDYTAFIDHLGIPALDLRFSGLNGNYHSIYDDFDFMDRVVDPGYAYHCALTDLWSRVTLRIADAAVVPLRYSNTARFVLDELQSLEDHVSDLNATRAPGKAEMAADFAAVRGAAEQFERAAEAIEKRADAIAATGGDAGAVNVTLMRAERDLLGDGLPGRTWFRHEIYAPGLNTGYAAVPLARMGQAVLDRDPDALRDGAGPIRKVLERAAQDLAK